MRLSDFLGGKNSTAALRKAIASAEEEAAATAERLDRATERRAAALLGTDAELDVAEGELSQATRELDRADAVRGELERRLEEAVTRERAAELDANFTQAVAAQAAGVKAVRSYGDLAVKMLAVLADLGKHETVIAEVNSLLEQAGDPRRVASADATARPQGELQVLAKTIQDELRLPSSLERVTLLWPNVTIWGSAVAPAERPAR